MIIVYKSAEIIRQNAPLYLFYHDSVSWFLMPVVTVVKGTIYSKFEVKIVSTAFEKNNQQAKDKVEDSKFTYDLQETRLISSPQIYSATNIWNREFFEITIHCSINKNVVIDDPINSWRDSSEKRNYVFLMKL